MHHPCVQRITVLTYYTLPTDQQFNLEFQFESVFNLEFQPKFGIQLGIPIPMGINLGECTCPLVVSCSLVGLVVSQKHHLQYNPSLLNWMYWSHHANLILIILIFIFIDLVASVKQGDNALGIASSHLSSYADYLADMVDLI